MKMTSKKGILFIVLLAFFLQIACLDNRNEKNTQGNDIIPVVKLEEDTVNQDINGFPVLIPVDEAPKNANLQETIQRIKYDLKTKNVESLLYYIADDIKISFSDNEEQLDFKTFWNLSNNPKDSKVWEVLESILELGGTFYNEKNFFIPYTFSRFPAEYNPYDFGVIISENTLLKKKPRKSSRTIGELSYEIVRVIAPKNEIDGLKKEQDDFWVKVKRQNETVGYVRRKDISRPTDYRLGFREKNGEWKINFLMDGI